MKFGGFDDRTRGFGGDPIEEGSCYGCSFIVGQGKCEVTGVNFPPNHSTDMGVGQLKLVPRDRIRNSSVGVAHDFVKRNDAGCCCPWKQFCCVCMQIIIHVVVVSGCTSVSFGVEYSGIQRVGNSPYECLAFGCGCWWCKDKRREELLSSGYDIRFVPQVLR